VVGAHQPIGIWVPIGRLCTLYYYFHFLVLLPLLGVLERPLPLPESISRAVLSRSGGAMPAGATAKPMEKA
jgi:ubiquinol-cytochrome c reductase cytochrome b/c1 subunit